jgi:hypothetical protein
MGLKVGVGWPKMKQKNTTVNYTTLEIKLIWFKTTRKTTRANHYVPDTFL